MRVAVLSVLLALLPAGGRCSICMLHNFHEPFYTDLNYMVRENGSSPWYVLAIEQPDLPYRTLYHLPKDLIAHRECYSYELTIQFGVVVMNFMCLGKEPIHSYHILTRPDGLYIASRKHAHEVPDFRTVHVVRLTKEIVVLVSCSKSMATYGVLVLHRGPWQAAQDDAHFYRTIVAKFPNRLYLWMNFTMTRASVGAERCNCSREYTIPIRASSVEGTEHDKRKTFVVVTLGTALAIGVIVKFLRRLF